MEQSRPWGVNIHSASQEMPAFMEPQGKGEGKVVTMLFFNWAQRH
jgi:hypothetical protein